MFECVSGRQHWLINPLSTAKQRAGAVDGRQRSLGLHHNYSDCHRNPEEPIIGTETSERGPAFCVGERTTIVGLAHRTRKVFVDTLVIHLQVHLQVPCYDFCPVQAIAIKPLFSETEVRRSVDFSK
jgi:hypothetical protein